MYSRTSTSVCTVGPLLVCISVSQAFIVDIFSSKDDEFLGRSSILPQHLKDDAGRLILTVFNKEMFPVGVIQCEYVWWAIVLSCSF